MARNLRLRILISSSVCYLSGVMSRAMPVLPAAAALPVDGAKDEALDSRLHGHLPVLDGVRGLAILMVLALHFIKNTTPTTPFEVLVARVCTFGMFGVDLFFVLSGFLITGILIDAKGSQGYFRNFYIRRALRIFPLYYGVLACLFFVAPLIPSLRSPELDALRHSQAWAWLYGVNIVTAIRGSFSLPYIDHFWSLAVEEHFYLFWPLIVWLCPRRTLVQVSMGIAVASLLARIALSNTLTPLTLYVLTPFRLDALCLGGFLAAIARGKDGLATLRRAVWPMVTGAVVVLVASYAFNRLTGTMFAPFHEARNATFVVLLASLLLTSLTGSVGSLSTRFFGAGAMRFLGKFSYGLYVFHHFIAYCFVHGGTEFVVARWVGSHTLAVAVQASFGFLASLGVAVASYHGFEKHFIALKRFWPATGESMDGRPRRAAGGPP
jgi:peptidoglycan/LPS O-acetylase OafA/YrhL